MGTGHGGQHGADVVRTLRFIPGILLAVGLSLWLAAIACAAVAAMNVFGTLDNLPLDTETYAAFDFDEQSRLVAARIMSGVFGTVDWMTFIGAALSAAGLMGVWMLPGRFRARNLILTLGIGAGAVCCIMYAIMSPELHSLLADRLAAAESGDVESARAIVAEFDPLHERANRLFQFQLGAVLIALIAFGSQQPQQRRYSDGHTS